MLRLVLGVYGIDIPPSVIVGSNLELAHRAVGLVVHEDTVIGNNVKIYQGVTIGRGDIYRENANQPAGSVVVQDGAILGAGAAVLFRAGEVLTIGHRAVVGANSVVLESIPPNEIWAGNPAKRVGNRR